MGGVRLVRAARRRQRHRRRSCAAFDAARSLSEPKPRVIICDTQMAKGVPFLEAREKSTSFASSRTNGQQALESLDAGRTVMSRTKRAP